MLPVTVVVATRIFPPEVGAAAFRLRQLVRALAEHGAHVHVVTSTPPPGSPPPPADPQGVRVSRRPVLRDRMGAVRGYLPYLSFDIPLVLRLLRGPRPHVIVAEPPPTTGLAVLLVARLRRVPYVYFAADLLADAAAAAGSPGGVVRVVRSAETTVLRRAALVLAVSDTVASRVRRLGVPAGRVVVVGNGVDTDLFSPDGQVVEQDRPYAVYAGTMSEIQGAGVFLDALAALPPGRRGFRVVFVGQGTQRTELEERARRSGLQDAVDFPGVLPPERTAAYLRGCAVALGSAVPGTGYEFATPTKLYAALACGAPVLFAGPGTGRDVAGHGLGRAVPYDPQRVAEALEAAVHDPPSARRRLELADWAARTVSLAAVGDRAAAAVLAAVTGAASAVTDRGRD